MAAAAPSGERLAIYRRVAEHPALTLGVGRAVLMQLAHPKIAAGVDDHSTVAHDPRTTLARLIATSRLGTALLIGSDAQADRAAAHINALHDRIRGTTRDGTAAVPSGSRYSAHDPRLQSWVLATLVDSMIVAHETYGGPLSAHDKDVFAAEAFRRVGPRLDLGASALPRSYAEVQTTLREVAGRGEIEVTPAARRLADLIVRPTLPLALRPLRFAARLPTVALLPEALRRAYGLRLSPRELRLHARAARASRALWRTPGLRRLGALAVRQLVPRR